MFSKREPPAVYRNGRVERALAVHAAHLRQLYDQLTQVAATQQAHAALLAQLNERIEPSRLEPLARAFGKGH
jgi:hypothetical protein